MSAIKGRSPKTQPKKTLKEIEEEIDKKGGNADPDDAASNMTVSEADSITPWKTVQSEGPTRYT